MLNIRQGSKANLKLKLRDENDDPIDLTGITDITTCFANITGPNLVLGYGTGDITLVGNPVLGKINIAIASADSALLKPVEGETLELSLTYGSDDPIKTAKLNAYNVIASQC